MMTDLNDYVEFPTPSPLSFKQLSININDIINHKEDKNITME